MQLYPQGNINVEIDMIIKITVEVQGKGKQYSSTVSVRPSD